MVAIKQYLWFKLKTLTMANQFQCFTAGLAIC